ncbi:MAG: HEPN domain-containing protein [Candidatus Caldarchaeum sp.]|nr:HEPN domain-containing protein [Candidatus Caldarchaeum sp.]MDW8435420.1 HEPN domain-containing protein [Candidatus Caldarchaeum sp.]
MVLGLPPNHDAMKMEKLAADYLKRARSRLVDAEAALARGDYPEVVRYCQELVELSLKACLRLVGIEYPKTHHVGDVLKLHGERFPEWFQPLVAEFDRISAELVIKRAPSMYGIEAAGKSPSELFDEAEASESLRKAKHVFDNVDKLFREKTGQASGPT